MYIYVHIYVCDVKSFIVVMCMYVYIHVAKRYGAVMHKLVD